MELQIWKQVLRIGRQVFGMFLSLHGTGDLGESVELPKGNVLPRFEEPYSRGLRTILGEFEPGRTVCGSRETQRTELVPPDTRLQLPESGKIVSGFDTTSASLLFKEQVGLDPVESLVRAVYTKNR